MEKATAEMSENKELSLDQPSSSSKDDDNSSIEWNEADEKRIRQRMDFRIVPVVFLLYLLCFIDRANIGNARIQGMAKDLNLVGYRFNYALTIFYISYIIVEIPSNIMLKIFGGRYYLPALVVAFGLVSMCTSFVQNFQGLLACRFFLGLTEGGMMPGIAYYLSCFYRRHELLFRIGLFVSGSSLAGAFGGLLAAGLSQIPRWGSNPAIHTWRNIFFFEGLFTICFACVAMTLLPSSPNECKFLTPRDRYIALERINREHKETVAAGARTEKKHIRRAVLNINNLICAMGFFSINVSVQSFSLFLPSILSALGWTALRTQFYSVPPYALACCWSIFVSWLSDRYRKRGLVILVGTSLALSGYIMLAVSHSNTVKYVAVFMAATGVFPLGPVFLVWGLNNAAGQTVRAVTSAYIVSLGSGGAIIATWTYLEKDKPRYLRGHYINIGVQIVAFSLASTGILYTKWENRKRERGGRDDRLVGLTEEQKGELGYRHPEFRYIS